jgi:hypothetical protein
MTINPPFCTLNSARRTSHPRPDRQAEAGDRR